MKRPNILFFMSDEHRADISGYEGNTTVRTPNIDWIAQTGVVFRNAYTPSPICIPARQCMAAGCYPSTCGVKRYGDDLAPGSMTFARRFSEYAYYTLACGKLHHPGPDQMQGWIRRITMEDQIIGPRYVDGAVESEFAKLGRSDEDRKGNLSGKKWTMQKEIKRAGPGRSPYTNWDELATFGAEAFLKEALISPYYDKTSDGPLLLYVGYANPHYPMIAPQELFEHYLNRVEPSANLSVPSNPWHHKADNYWRGPLSVGPDGEVSEREERRAVAAYYANVEDMDTRCGRVLDALRAAGEDLDEWIIIYTSDHGEMMGDHGFWEKHSFYESSVRVPLVIRWPRGFEGGRAVEENVNLVDLFATMCDLAGIDMPAAPEVRDSRSLVPLLNGSPEGWQNTTYSEIDGTCLMVKDGPLKYNWYGDEYPEELFDLSVDPCEADDLVADPDRGNDLQRLRELRRQFTSSN
jgi:choline-sulfatase